MIVTCVVCQWDMRAVNVRFTAIVNKSWTPIERQELKRIVLWGMLP